LELADDAPGEPTALELDPFSGHLAFAGRMGMVVRPFWEGSPIRPVEPLDAGADKLVDFEALDALGHMQAGFKAPRAWRDDKIEPRLADWLRQCEPQFNLRNLGRAERFADPAMRLPLEASKIPLGPTGDELKEVREARHEPPELLEDDTMALMGRYRAWVRWLYRVTDWEMHFGQEVKTKLEVPLWQYDPYQAIEGADGSLRVPAGDRPPPPEVP
jgi:hypothetical protein